MKSFHWQIFNHLCTGPVHQILYYMLSNSMYKHCFWWWPTVHHWTCSWSVEIFEGWPSEGWSKAKMATEFASLRFWWLKHSFLQREDLHEYFAHWWSSFVVELFGDHHAAFSGRFPEGLVQQHCAMATRVTGASTLGPNQAQTVTTFAEDPRVQLRDQAATPWWRRGCLRPWPGQEQWWELQVHREICLQIWAFGDKNIMSNRRCQHGWLPPSTLAPISGCSSGTRRNVDSPAGSSKA